MKKCTYCKVFVKSPCTLFQSKNCINKNKSTNRTKPATEKAEPVASVETDGKRKYTSTTPTRCEYCEKLKIRPCTTDKQAKVCRTKIILN